MDPAIVGVGPPDEKSLRVSAATLSRVLFPHPDMNEQMLALEHKATLIAGEDGVSVAVQAQPFGGAVRIIDTERLADQVGGFNFDSERSKSERDFRIYIRPSCWEVLIDFCLQQRSPDSAPIIESDPTRELSEEFIDTLGTTLTPDQYNFTPSRIVIENHPSPTTNVRASGVSTVRIYWTYTVEILDASLCRSILVNSDEHPAPVLSEWVIEHSSAGGSSRANAILAASIKEIHAAYRSAQPEAREKPLSFKDTILAGNVPSILEEMFTQKYVFLNP